MMTLTLIFKVKIKFEFNWFKHTILILISVWYPGGTNKPLSSGNGVSPWWNISIRAPTPSVNSGTYSSCSKNNINSRPVTERLTV